MDWSLLPKKTTQKEARGIFDWIWLVVSAGGIEAFLIAKSVKARHKSRSVISVRTHTPTIWHPHPKSAFNLLLKLCAQLLNNFNLIEFNFCRQQRWEIFFAIIKRTKGILIYMLWWWDDNNNNRQSKIMWCR